MTIEEAITRISTGKRLALNQTSNCTADILKIEGFSTDIQRHLFNNLCAGQTRYLEIGAFCGATVAAAAALNPMGHIQVVENYCQDFSSKDVRDKLYASCKLGSTLGARIGLVEKDAFDGAHNDVVGNVDVFFFDGEHSYESQFKALPFYLDKMAPVFIYAVDDYAWKDVERGTQDAIAQLVQEKKLRVAFEWSVQPPENDHPIWHNGLYLGVMERLV